MLKLNLGASDDHKPGFVCVDLKAPACEKCGGLGAGADLRDPWPWDTSSVEAIYAKDVAEHIGSGYRLVKKWHRGIPGGELMDVDLVPYNGIIHFLNEAHRVLKPGGRMELIVPCYPGIAVWCDPTHASVWTSDTRFYFDERWSDPKTGERGRLGPGMGITALFRTLPGSQSGVDWTPIQYSREAPDRRKLFLVLEAVK